MNKTELDETYDEQTIDVGEQENNTKSDDNFSEKIIQNEITENKSSNGNQIEEDFELKLQISDNNKTKTSPEIISNNENTESKSTGSGNTNKRDPDELKELMELRTEVVKAREKYAALHKEIGKTEEDDVTPSKKKL